MKRSLVCLAVLLALGAHEADAQCHRVAGHRICVRHERDHDDRGPVEFGVRGGYDFEEEVGMAGAQVRVPLVSFLAVAPSFDVFFDESDSEWQGNADLLVRPRELSGLYGGGGAAFLRRDFDADGEEETEVGWNLLVGLDGGRIADTRLRPFAEARWSDVEDYDAFRLVAGINVPVSR